ncbi:MAG: potassium-transporting ATPase subunit KdpC [Proteobacteria bacterium]|nr:potassium-transporting ATPase subunit KdpC [Pseudomonadota bacterium]
MRTIFFQSIRSLALMTLLTGVLYPLAVTLVGQGIFREKANGSIVKHENLSVGSVLLAQKFSSEDYFWSRPSSSDYQSVPGGASNLGPTSQKLKDRIESARKSYGVDDNVPHELLLSSGSGLDPHISPETAKFQVPRIAAKRGLKKEVLEELIGQLTELPTWGVLGRPRVNVLKLNLAINEFRK